MKNVGLFHMNSWYINDISHGRGDFDQIIYLHARSVCQDAYQKGSWRSNINVLVVFLVNVHLKCIHM